MGTHPIFESDFDCLTEMGLIDYLALLVVAVNSKQSKNQFTPSCNAGEFLMSRADTTHGDLFDQKLNHKWGACVMQGHRSHMEDRIITQSYFNGLFSMYIVFDGHGGDTVVNYAQE